MSNVPTNLIPTTVTGLPEYTGSSTLGYLPYVVDGRTYKVQFSNIAAVGAVPSSRTIATGTGLTGGGDLSADRTIAIANGGVGTAQLAASGVSAGVYGSGTLVPVLTVDATGRVTSATTAAVSVSGFVPTSRSVIAGTGLTGGGALTSDVTLNVNFSSSTPQALGTATAGVSTAAARGDHVHPAVNLADTSQTQGALPLGRGGTGDALSPVAGAVVYSTGTRFALTALGLPGQVLMSDGANAPQWATVSGIGTVTSVNVSGGTTGLTFSGGPVTAAGTITMAGTLAVGNGGTGLTTLAANFVPKGNGTAAFSASQIFDNGTNVGIGTTSPSAKLHVVGNALFTGASSQTLDIGTSTGIAYIQSYGAGTAAAPIVFYTGTSERMRITAAGDVGVGTSAPTAKLSVGDAAAAKLNLMIGASERAYIDYTEATTLMRIDSDANMAFNTNNTERMRILSAGEVGIGTSAPSARFHVEGTTNATSTVLFKNTNSAATAFFQLGFGNDANNSGLIRYTSSTYTGATNSFLYYADNHVFHNLGGTERMRVTSAGDVGIGIATPGARLHVVGGNIAVDATARRIGYITDGTASNTGYMIPYDAAGFLSIHSNFSAGGIKFHTGTANTERMRIDSAGLVGIGTTNPAARLHVVNSAIADQFRLQDVLTDATIKYGVIGSGHYTNAEEPFLMAMGVSSSTSNNLALGGGATSLNAATVITFFTAANITTTTGTERMRIVSSGEVGIGTSSPGARLHVVNANHANMFRLQDVVTDATNKIAAMGMGHYTNAEEPIALISGISTLTGTSLTIGGNVSSMNAAMDIAFNTATTPTTLNGTTRLNVKANGQVRFVPLAAAPGSPEAGDVYYDSTTNKLRCYNGTTWNDLF